MLPLYYPYPRLYPLLYFQILFQISVDAGWAHGGCHVRSFKARKMSLDKDITPDLAIVAVGCPVLQYTDTQLELMFVK